MLMPLMAVLYSSVVILPHETASNNASPMPHISNLGFFVFAIIYCFKGFNVANIRHFFEIAKFMD